MMSERVREAVERQARGATGDQQSAGPQIFRLYIAGNAPNSMLALDNFRVIARDYISNYELEIIDIEKDPLPALEDEVFVTPTLVRLSPPVVRIIGNLSETARVLSALGLKRTMT